MIVYTAGVFDLFHIGHLNILRKSKALGDKLVVGVLTDDGAAAYKDRPIIPERHRLEIVRSIPCVDLAIYQESTDPTRELQVIRPDIFTHGSDWSRLKQGHKTLKKMGIKYMRLPYTRGVSSSEIKQQIWKMLQR